MEKERLCISTLGCPDWPIERVGQLCREKSIIHIELRGGPAGHLAPDWPPERIQHTLDCLKQAGVRPWLLASYAVFNAADTDARDANARILADYCRLAESLGAPFVRANIGMPAAEDVRSEEVVCADAAKALQSALNQAGTSGVSILVETHDWSCDPARMARIMAALPSNHFGVIWDSANCCVEGFDVQEVYARLRGRIGHVHVKDHRTLLGGAIQHCRVGAGEVPLRDAICLLEQDSYNGLYSLEWEKAWCPELEEIDAALPAYVGYMGAVRCPNN